MNKAVYLYGLRCFSLVLVCKQGEERIPEKHEWVSKCAPYTRDRMSLCPQHSMIGKTRRRQLAI